VKLLDEIGLRTLERDSVASIYKDG